MVPALAALASVTEGLGLGALPSIGFLPAVLALSLYSVLPILRNTVTGLAGVDPDLLEAARGVGMDRREVLWQVEQDMYIGRYRHTPGHQGRSCAERC